MSNSLGYAVVNGVLESILAGYALEDKQAKDAAEAARAKQDKEEEYSRQSTDALVTNLTAKENAGRAFMFINSINMVDEAGNLSLAGASWRMMNEQQQAQVLQAGASYYSGRAKDLVTQAASQGPEYARSLMADQSVLEILSNDRAAMAQISSIAAIPISKDQMEWIKTLQGSKQEKIALAEASLGQYAPNSPFYQFVDSYVKNLKAIEVPSTYNSVDTSIGRIQTAAQTEISNAKEAERDANFQPLLKEVESLIQQVGMFALVPSDEEGGIDDRTSYSSAHPKAVAEHIALLRLRDQMVAGELGQTVEEIAARDPSYFLEMFTNAKELVEEQASMSGTTGAGRKERASAAQKQLAVLTQLGVQEAFYDRFFDQVGETYKIKEEFEGNPIVEESMQALAALQQTQNVIEDIANDANTFVSGANTPNERTFDFTAKEPMMILSAANKIPELDTFFEGLPPIEQKRFMLELQEAMANVRTGSSYIKDGAQVTVAGDPNLAFDARFKNLSDNLPEFADAIRASGNVVGGTGAVQTTNATQPENGNEFVARRGVPPVVAGAALQSIAESRQTSPQELLLTNPVYYDLLRMGELNDQRLFVPVQKLTEMGIFTQSPGVSITSNQSHTVVNILAKNRVYDLNDTLDIVAASIVDPQLPPGIEQDKFRIGFTEKQLNEVIQTALGRQIDFKTISKGITDHEAFLGVAKKVQNLLDDPNVSSRAADDLSMTVLNLFGLDGSYFKTIGGRIVGSLTEGSMFKQADLRDGFTMGRMQEMADQALAQDFAVGQAQLRAALVTLAYNYAKTMDPSGRISERDFAAALDAVGAGSLDTIDTRRGLIADLINDAEKSLTYKERTFKIKATGQGQNARYRLSTANLQRMYAMTHFRALNNSRRSIGKLQQYTTLLDSTSGQIMRNGRFLPIQNNIGSGVFTKNGFGTDYGSAETAFMTMNPAFRSNPQALADMLDRYNITTLTYNGSPILGDDNPVLIDSTTGRLIPMSTIRSLAGIGA